MGPPDRATQYNESISYHGSDKAISQARLVEEVLACYESLQVDRVRGERDQ